MDDPDWHRRFWSARLPIFRAALAQVSEPEDTQPPEGTMLELSGSLACPLTLTPSPPVVCSQQEQLIAFEKRYLDPDANPVRSPQRGKELRQIEIPRGGWWPAILSGPLRELAEDVLDMLQCSSGDYQASVYSMAREVVAGRLKLGEVEDWSTGRMVGIPRGLWPQVLASAAALADPDKRHPIWRTSQAVTTFGSAGRWEAAPGLQSAPHLGLGLKFNNLASAPSTGIQLQAAAAEVGAALPECEVGLAGRHRRRGEHCWGHVLDLVVAGSQPMEWLLVRLTEAGVIPEPNQGLVCSCGMRHCQVLLNKTPPMLLDLKLVPPANIAGAMLWFTGSRRFLSWLAQTVAQGSLSALCDQLLSSQIATESQHFDHFGMATIPPEQREAGPFIIEPAQGSSPLE